MKKAQNLLLLLVTLVVAIDLSSGRPILAQSYPDRPLKLIVPFIAGSPVDALARVVAQHLSARLGQSVIIENQSGAGGTIGTKTVANAARDGHTLLFAINSHVYGLYSNPGYDPLKSFEPIGMIAQWSHVLVLRPDLPIRNLRELVTYTKTKPGQVTFGFGINTPPQILGETLKIVAGMDVQSVPYRGGAQAIQDMLGGRIDMNFGATATLLPLIRGEKLKAIAYTGAKRSPDLPDVPTVIEAGYPQIAFNPDAWAAILAPAGTPSELVTKLNTEINAALHPREMSSRLAEMGYEARPMSQPDFAKFLVAEMNKWPPIVKAAGLKSE